ncbi:probable carotenoid cleavage dioxygenase 4, chloroplastic [Salvia hispanica]|uniref:probable carotenoid cleavage dioxygenase 4, chloroplastic n=1 Tax=Salvia hispanica TaxID=49212 RepID=UPI002009507B|nr:probable carotenoid cleavage dioxygenase 4, chloroplastic [Salvia hispanica]
MLQRSVLFPPNFPKPPSLRKENNNLVAKLISNASHPSSISIDQNPKHINPKQSPLTKIFNSLDDMISNFLELPLTPSNDPNHLLSGNFAPVNELPPTACEVVEGSIPASLHGGAYIRNGPNPHFIPRGPYHPFDGDGMLHSVRISGASEAIFCSRYVKTYKFITEAENGSAFFPSPFSWFNGRLASAAHFFLTVARVVSGSFDPSANGFGTANTSLTYFNRELYALCESDLPYQIHLAEDGDILTLGRREFGGGGDMTQRMTAHPHTDSGGQVFAFKCNMFPPFLTFFRIDSEGRKGAELAIKAIKRMPIVHDFGLTEQFIVFQDLQIEMDPTEMLWGRTPMVFNREKVPRIGVLRRDAADDGGLAWIETPGLNFLHVINAWEGDRGGRVVIVAPNFLSLDRGFLNVSLIYSEIEMIELDVNEKKVVSRHVLSGRNMEFGVVNQAYAGKQTKYMYAAVIGESIKAAGVVKLDLSKAGAEGGDCMVASREYGLGCYGGELCFVAGEGAEEDDGYLVTYVHDEIRKESWFWVMKAKSPTLEVVARVKLPGRVPYGFHGLFVPEKDLLTVL